jgi:hypothetical protein
MNEANPGPREDMRGRYYPIGSVLRTDYSGTWTTHRVTDRRAGCISQSGIMFLLDPPVPKSREAWLDADWFTPPDSAIAGAALQGAL